jgi:hypothetical protein
MQDYHQLDVWNRAMDYAVSVYKLAADLPQEEKYNLAHQLRKAVTSAPLNMAEGCGSASNMEFARLQLRLPFREGSQISRMTYNLMRKIDGRSNS